MNFFRRSNTAKKTETAAPASGTRKFQLRRQSVVLVAVVVTLLLIASVFGLLDGLELSAVNWAFQRRGAEAPASPVTIVAIDDDSLSITGLQWPWPRTYLAQIVDRLHAGGAKAIAFDVFFFEPGSSGAPATYTAQGDTLIGIAKQFGVTAPDLIAANNLDNNGRVCGGQELTIPTSPEQKYTVVRDTVEALAARYQIGAKLLMQRNNLADPCDLRPSQLLQIPIGPTLDYTVQAGDTVESIAALYQINPRAIVNADGHPVSDPLPAGETVTVQFGDAAFAAAIQAAGNVILNGEVARATQTGSTIESLRQPIGLLREAAAGFGITNIGADADGTVHSIQAWDQTSDRTFYSWPVVAAALYSGQTLGNTPSTSAFVIGNEQAPLAYGALRVNFRGGQKTFPTYSAMQVVNGDLPLATFKDKIVFIGATTQSLHDIYATPFVPKNPPGVPGVEIMANALDTVLSGHFLYLRSGVCAGEVCPIAARGPMLLSIIISGVMALGLTLIRRTNVAILALVGLMLGGIVIWLAAFFALNTEIPVVAPLGALFVAFVTPTLERAVSEELEKRRVRGIFEMFISPEMVGQLIDQGVDAMRGKRAPLTILFSDIRGFTTMSEKMTPEQLVETLNEYLGVMTEVIHKHGGTVDKYEGDLIMAFFGAPISYPDHAQRAVRASIEMRMALDTLRQKWEGEGKPSKLEMGIGLNSAEVFVGLVGSGRRVNYTVMGDGVNLASRVQDLTKDLQWPLLITEFTYEIVKNEFDADFGDSRLVKGKTVPVGMYKVRGEKGAPEERRVRALYA